MTLGCRYDSLIKREYLAVGMGVTFVPGKHAYWKEVDCVLSERLQLYGIGVQHWLHDST